MTARLLRLAAVSLGMLVILTVLTGVVYPLVMTGAAQALFKDKADGSLVKLNGHVVGSKLVGQGFTSPSYFHSRPSATSPPYQPLPTTFANLGPATTTSRPR
jgi:K+-transporting ATPase ATPase C chain